MKILLILSLLLVTINGVFTLTDAPTSHLFKPWTRFPRFVYRPKLAKLVFLKNLLELSCLKEFNDQQRVEKSLSQQKVKLIKERTNVRNEGMYFRNVPEYQKHPRLIIRQDKPYTDLGFRNGNIALYTPSNNHLNFPRLSRAHFPFSILQFPPRGHPITVRSSFSNPLPYYRGINAPPPLFPWKILRHHRDSDTNNSISEPSLQINFQDRKPPLFEEWIPISPVKHLKKEASLMTNNVENTREHVIDLPTIENQSISANKVTAASPHSKDTSHQIKLYEVVELTDENTVDDKIKHEDLKDNSKVVNNSINAILKLLVTPKQKIFPAPLESTLTVRPMRKKEITIAPTEKLRDSRNFLKNKINNTAKESGNGSLRSGLPSEHNKNFSNIRELSEIRDKKVDEKEKTRLYALKDVSENQLVLAESASSMQDENLLNTANSMMSSYKQPAIIREVDTESKTYKTSYLNYMETEKTSDFSPLQSTEIFFTSNLHSSITPLPPSDFLNELTEGEYLLLMNNLTFDASHDFETTTSHDIFKFSIDNKKEELNLTERQEPNWKNSRKMHFGQEAQENLSQNRIKGAFQPVPRRSDILIEDTLKDYLESQSLEETLEHIKRLQQIISETNPDARVSYELLVPQVISVVKDLRQDKLSHENITFLSQVFGENWPYIVALSKDENLDLLPLMKMKSEKDWQKVLEIYSLKDSASSTTEKGEREGTASTRQDNFYIYEEEYQDEYQNMFGERFKREGVSKGRRKRNEEESVRLASVLTA